MTESTLLSAEKLARNLSLSPDHDSWDGDLKIIDEYLSRYSDTLRTALAAETERRERAEEALVKAEPYREKYLQLSAQHVREVEAGERALAELRKPVADVEDEVFYAFTTDSTMRQVRTEVVLADLARQLAATVRERDARIAVLHRIAWLIGSIYCFGNFKAETVNERELEQLLRSVNCFWPTVADFDAALTQPTRGEE